MVDLKEDETIDEINGVKIIQKKGGYRFSVDSVLLADFIDLAGMKEAVDLGTGSGIIAVLMATRSQELKVTGIELQDKLFELAIRNITISSLRERVGLLNIDMRKVNVWFSEGSFDLVVSNPPYYITGTGRLGSNMERIIARHEVEAGMEDVVDAARHLLRKKGRLGLIYPVERRDEVLSTMKRLGIGPKRIREVNSKQAGRLLIEGEKGYSGPAEELPPLSF